MISSRPGDDVTLSVLRLGLDGVETLTVRGHRAVAGQDAAGSTSARLGWRSVAWVERPGEVVQVSAAGASQAELVAVAEGLEPASEREWAALVRSSQLGDLAPDPTAVELGRGAFGGGVDWVLRQLGEAGDGSIDLALAFPDPGVGGILDSEGSSSFADQGSSIGAEAQPATFRETTWFARRGRYFAAGLVDARVARVELRRSGGSSAGTATLVHRGSRHAWVAEVEAQTAEVVALDADGRELGRTSLTFDDTSDSSSDGSAGPVSETTAAGATAPQVGTETSPVPTTAGG